MFALLSACAALSAGNPPLSALVGTPSIIPALVSRTAAGVSPIESVPQAFQFPLDEFQLDSLRALHEGQSVVVSSPTGSGKTVCGEIGCYLALCAAPHSTRFLPFATCCCRAKTSLTY